MDEYPWRERIGPVVRIQQIIVGALIAGCVFFLGIAIALPMRGAEPSEPILIYVLLVMAVPILVARVVVPSIMLSRSRQSIARGKGTVWSQAQGLPHAMGEFLQQGGDAAKLAMALQTVLIVSVAPLEGLAFFATIVFMIEGSLPALAVAVVMILCIAWHFPTQRSVIAAVENQLRILEQERLLQSGGPERR
jgi:hypothetical protein